MRSYPAKDTRTLYTFTSRWLQWQLRKLCVRSWKGINVEDGHELRKMKRGKFRRYSAAETSFARSDYLDVGEDVALTMSSAARASYSTPNSPHKALEKVSERQDAEKEGGLATPTPEEHLASSPSSSRRSSLLTLNDAEISLTNEQAKLVRDERWQYDFLVGILKAGASPHKPFLTRSSFPFSEDCDTLKVIVEKNPPEGH